MNIDASLDWSHHHRSLYYVIFGLSSHKLILDILDARKRFHMFHRQPHNLSKFVISGIQLLF